VYNNVEFVLQAISSKVITCNWYLQKQAYETDENS